MPQKRNPDAAELVRAKAGTITGALVSLLTVLKGLPLAYSKDMQDDKEPTFLAADTLSLSLQAMSGMIRDLEPQADAMKRAAGNGFSTATDLADWIVQKLGLPFRKAHDISAKIVRRAEAKNCLLEDLDLKEMRAVEPRITSDVFSVLSLEKSAASRTSFGGTAPKNVRRAAAAARRRFL